MWGLEKEPMKTESALHRGEKLHNRACNTWTNKRVTVGGFQTIDLFKIEWDHKTGTK